MKSKRSIQAVVVCFSLSLLAAYVIHAQRKVSEASVPGPSFAPSSKKAQVVFSPEELPAGGRNLIPSTKRAVIFTNENPQPLAPTPAPRPMLIPGSKSYSPAFEIKGG